MNDKTRNLRRAGALAVVAAAAVLATACGSSDPSVTASATGGSATYGQEVALAQCMRSHGEPGFPDPAASGGFTLKAATLGSSQTRVAYGSCRHLLPGGGPNLSQLQQEAQQRLLKELPVMLKFTHCMRSHGVPGFPDPALNGTAPKSAATIDPQSPQFRAAVHTCHPPAGLSLHMHTSGTVHKS